MNKLLKQFDEMRKMSVKANSATSKKTKGKKGKAKKGSAPKPKLPNLGGLLSGLGNKFPFINK